IATWNVNSLKARLEKVVWWLDRAKPDVLLMQETKLSDADAPVEAFQQAGYGLAHHGEGRWNGVAIASRVGIAEVSSNFGQPLRAPVTPDVPDDEPLAEARMVSAVCGGVRVVSLYAPNGRSLDSPFYQAKLAWYERLARWLAESRDPGEALALGGDYNIAPGDADVWDPEACHGWTHVPEPERRARTHLRSGLDQEEVIVTTRARRPSGACASADRRGSGTGSATSACAPAARTRSALPCRRGPRGRRYTPRDRPRSRRPWPCARSPWQAAPCRASRAPPTSPTARCRGD